MQISAEKIWNTAQEHLRVKLSRDTFNMWFAPLRASAIDGHNLTIEAPNEFCEVWLKDNYLSLMQDAVAITRPGATARVSTGVERRTSERPSAIRWATVADPSATREFSHSS